MTLSDTPLAVAETLTPGHMTAPVQSLRELLDTDLEYIGGNLGEEFGRMAGKDLLITGGAGFLGYYLVQSVLFWNRSVEPGRRIRLTVFDNYIRGVPSWLTALESDRTLRLV